MTVADSFVDIAWIFVSVKASFKKGMGTYG